MKKIKKKQIEKIPTSIVHIASNLLFYSLLIYLDMGSNGCCKILEKRKCNRKSISITIVLPVNCA